MKKRNLLATLLILLSHYTFAYQPTDAELHQNSALCSYGYNSNCGGYNSSYSSPIVYLPSRYGAVVLGEFKNSTKHFSTFNESSARLAKKKALAKCKKDGADKCFLMVDYSNQCVSGAEGASNGVYNKYYDFGHSKQQANNAVLEKCKSNDEKSCRLIMEAECSYY